MASNVTIQDLMGALQKAGYDPSANSYDTGQNTPNIENNLQANANSDPMLSYLRQNYGDQVAKVAQLDQHLSGIYSNPSSPYFIKDPGKVSKIVSSAQNLGYKAAGNIKSQYSTRQSNLNSQVSQAKSLLGTLKSNQAAKESNTANADTNAGVKSKVIFGNVVPVTSKAKGQSAQNKTITASGLTDKNAINEFLKAPKEFQNQWIRNLSDHSTPPAAYTQQQMQNDVVNYKVAQRKETQTVTKKAPAPKSARNTSTIQW